MSKLNVTFVQADLFWEDTESNLKHFDELLRRINVDTDLLILPEMFSTGFSMNSTKLAEEMGGKSMTWMQKKAEELNCVVMGSLILKEKENFFNRLIAMDKNGSYSIYDKKHLFSLGHEDENYQAGSRRSIVEVQDWKICPLICYDLRFPEWSRNREDYDLLVYVANWPNPRQNHWRTLLAARAVENQCYVIGVNRVGTDGKAFDYSGYSSIYDYNGNLIVERIEEESVTSYELKKQPLIDFRKKLPFLKDQEL